MSNSSLYVRVHHFFNGVTLKRIDESTIELIDKNTDISLGILYYGTGGLLNRYMKPKNINNIELWLAGFIKLFESLKTKGFHNSSGIEEKERLTLVSLDNIFKRIFVDGESVYSKKHILDYISNIEVVNNTECTKITVKNRKSQLTVDYKNGINKNEVLVNLLKDHIIGVSNPNIRRILSWRGNLKDLTYEEKELFKKIKLVENILGSRYRELHSYYGLSFNLERT